MNFASRLLVFAAVAKSKDTREDALVETSKGKLRGVRRVINDIGVDSYYGIPFAEPPVGSLRFKEPQEEKEWADVLDATFAKPLCSQVMNCTGCEGYTTSEDCLYLNVFGPSDTTEKLPVYVWIHGGSFTGDWHPKWYEGAQQVAHGGFVSVIVNYRLGALGFLSTGDGVIRGNFGVLDQQLAFDWVHKHIHHFGGDASKITIYGQSAGAICVKFHSISPMSGTVEAPKFKNVMVNSGQQMAYNAHPAETAQSFARNSGCLTEFLISTERFRDCVLALPVDEVVEASSKESVVQFNWSPVVDGEFLAEAPTRDFMNNRGQTERFNFMVTTVTGEIGIGAGSIRSERMFRLFNKPILGALHPEFDVDNEQFWIDLETFYLPNGDIEMATADEWRTAYLRLGMDSGYTSYAYELADTGRHSGAPFWMMNFQYVVSEELMEEDRLLGEWNEPWHGDDLMFYFGYPLEADLGTTKEVELSKKLMHMFGSFGRTGVPVLDGHSWDEFNPEGNTLIVTKDHTFYIDEHWRLDAMIYWKTHLLVNFPKPEA